MPQIKFGESTHAQNVLFRSEVELCLNNKNTSLWHSMTFGAVKKRAEEKKNLCAFPPSSSCSVQSKKKKKGGGVIEFMGFLLFLGIKTRTFLYIFVCSVHSLTQNSLFLFF